MFAFFLELPDGFGSIEFKPPENIPCIIQSLCSKWEGIFVDAKGKMTSTAYSATYLTEFICSHIGIKEHWWKPHIKRMIERRLLKSRSQTQMLGLFDPAHYEFNM